jgi:hypothetical protein
VVDAEPARNVVLTSSLRASTHGQRLALATYAWTVLPFVAGCPGSPSTDRPPRDLALEVGRVCATDLVEAKSASRLRATLRVLQGRVTHIQDLAVDVTLSNTSSAPAPWLGTDAEAGSLALEVRDSSCQVMAPGPPPTPRMDDGVTNWNTLVPNASVALAFRGWLSSDVQPGRYEVRFRGIPGDKGNADVRSAWVAFEVTAAGDGS